MASMFINFVFGMIPEVLFFCLFLIYTKKLKHKRLELFILMLFEYFILKLFINYDVWFQIAYTFITFILLKVLYKEKAIITDIFVFALASIILIIISFLSYMIIFHTLNNYVIAYILNRILLFSSFYFYKDKLNIFYNKFNSMWNRKPNAKVRSLTIRNISVIIFNLMFYVINIGMIYFLLYLK